MVGKGLPLRDFYDWTSFQHRSDLQETSHRRQLGERALATQRLQNVPRPQPLLAMRPGQTIAQGSFSEKSNEQLDPARNLIDRRI